MYVQGALAPEPPPDRWGDAVHGDRALVRLGGSSGGRVRRAGNMGLRLVADSPARWWGRLSNSNVWSGPASVSGGEVGAVPQWTPP